MREFWLEFLLSGQPYWLGLLVGAVISFTATFAGVLASFSYENARHRRREREAFGRLIESVLIESANSQAVLRNVAEKVAVGCSVPVDLRTDAIQAALLSQLTVSYAPYSLVKAMSIVSTWLRTFNNILASQRTAASVAQGLTESGVDGLKVRAEACRKLIVDVLQAEIEALPETLRAHMVVDPRSQRVDERLQAILGEEREQLLAMRQRK